MGPAYENIPQQRSTIQRLPHSARRVVWKLVVTDIQQHCSKTEQSSLPDSCRAVPLSPLRSYTSKWRNHVLLFLLPPTQSYVLIRLTIASAVLDTNRFSPLVGNAETILKMVLRSPLRVRVGNSLETPRLYSQRSMLPPRISFGC